MKCLSIAALSILFFGCALAPAIRENKIRDSQLVEVRVSQFHMGMMVDLVAWAPTEREGREACAAAFKKIAALNAILSDYEPESELSRFCRNAGGGPQVVSAELLTVLNTARDLSDFTDGRYDVTAAPVIKLWRQARKTGRLPEQNAIAEALKHVGYEKLSLCLQESQASLVEQGMQIDLGSIAKGYIGDEAIAVLRSYGCSRAAYIAGGDMVFGDAPPGKKGWPVQPARPGMEVMELANCGFSVSGDTVQFLEVAGKRYSHVIDARTGQPLTDHTMCIVIAKNGLLSDPLSTIGTILPEPQFKALVKRYAPDAQVWIFKAD